MRLVLNLLILLSFDLFSLSPASEPPAPATPNAP